jgi:rSAM/selenodomain-associated transferase 2
VTLSVIVPMLNEEHVIGATLDAIRRGAPDAEIIVVDGGSTDRSGEIARPRCNLLIHSAPGRARQMNAGASATHSAVLAFVHADTFVPARFATDIAAALADPGIVGGRFDVELDERSPAMQMLGKLISIRSRLMHSATGDQAIFVRSDVFRHLGGFPEIELCEDVEFVRRLRRVGRFACLRSRVITSARRWQRDGLFRTIIRMWVIKSLYLAGISPGWLRRHYTDTR